MEAMIKRILDIDERARKITDAAQKERRDSEQEIAERARCLRDDYLKKPGRASVSTWKPSESWLIWNGSGSRRITPGSPPVWNSWRRTTANGGSRRSSPG